jgi:diguanylate cyclase (GGDEF)-like protein
VPSRTSRQATPAIALVILATSLVMALPFGGSAFWLCVPAALLAAALAPTGPGAALASIAVLAAAAGVLAWRGEALPSPAVAVAVPLLSVTVLVAVRERLERERDALRSVALSDPLTGVANRRSLHERAVYEIARHTRERRSFTVVMLDLDGFKGLNDRFGHAAGDEILCDVTDALKAALRGQDTLARLGGDEFCVLAPLTDRGGSPALASRVADAVGHATTGVETLRASLGLAVFPEDGTTVAELLHAADERLLEAKRGRRGAQRRRAA